MSMEVKRQQERKSRKRRREEDKVDQAPAMAKVVVKQEGLSPEAKPPPTTHQPAPGAPLSPLAWRGGSRAWGGSRSPARKKHKASARRSKSPWSPHHSAVKGKQEPEEHPRRGPGRQEWQHPHRAPSEQEHRRARDRHQQGHSRQHRSSPERPASAQAQGHDRDLQSLQAQDDQREFDAARRHEHRQQHQVRGGGHESQEVVPRPAGKKETAAAVKEKPSFELSGALLEDTNTFRGVVLQYTEPPEARIPRKRWRLYPFKNDQVLPVMHIHRQSAYLLGRHRLLADIPMDHPSCSKQHAVLQYRLVGYTRADGTFGRRVRPYIIDLGSGNGTFLNNKRLEPHRYYELKEKDVLQFGFSSREYVLLHESSDTSELDGKEDEDDQEEEGGL